MKILDEEQVIKKIWGTLRESGDPFEEDVSWVRLSKEKLLVSKSDMLVSSTDVPRGMSTLQLASKSITACVSDFAAKGVTPRFCLLSLAIPRRNANARFVRELALGFKKAASRYNVKILSGDTNASLSDITIDCVMFGFADSVIKRSGARIGDLVGVSGGFGEELCGLLILEGKADTKDGAFKRKAVRSVLNPSARNDFSWRTRNLVSSSIDSSDGLAISLYHLAESSKVNIGLDCLPITEGVESFAKENSLRAEDLVLFGGEEYELVMTYPEKYSRRIENAGLIPVGRVTERIDGESKVFFKDLVLARKGWSHFSRV